MLITLGVVAGLAAATGAGSLASWVTEVLKSRSRAEQSSSSKAASLPQHLAVQPQVVHSLLDDVELKLRPLRREKPGPERRCAVHEYCSAMLPPFMLVLSCSLNDVTPAPVQHPDPEAGGQLQDRGTAAGAPHA